MKKTIFTRLAMAAITVAAIGCQREDALVDGGQNGSSANLVPFTINATLEGGETKTTLEAGGKVYWESGDAITVLGVGENGTVGSYKLTTKEGGSSTLFEGEVELAKDYYVIYPHTDAGRLPYLNSTKYTSWMCTVEDSQLRVYFPSMQKVSAVKENAPTSIDAYCVGVVAEDKTVAFKNLGGLIKINIPVEGVEHVILYGNADETIVGNALVTFGDDGFPVIASRSGANTVRIVPAKGSTFEPGEYYINVLPVVFSNGLSVIFTKSDKTWASVRSSKSFVVERSKISYFPEIKSLTFGGKVVDIISVNEKTGKPAQPFATKDTDEKELPVPPSSNGHAGTPMTYTLEDGGYQVTIFGTDGHSKTTAMGLQFGKKMGDYVTLPKISGYALNKVVVRCAADANGAGSPMIQTANGIPVVGGEVWGELAKPFNVEYTWSFSGKVGEAYRIIRTTDENKYTPFPQIRLYYADAPSGVSSINPMITSVTTKEVETEHKGKVTFKGVFSAVDYQTSLLSCGFDYRPVGNEAWETVSLDPTANDFSYEVEIDSDEDYEYRAWTKVNKTEKTVYGDWVQFNARKIVLHLVFDDNYYTREDKYNFLLREWGWGTNSHGITKNPNDKTYYYNYNGIDYPFTFWSYRSSDSSKGCYSLRASEKNQKVYGLCLSYTTADGFDPVAWMLLPGPQDFKLTNLNTTLYAAFAGTISTAVNADGKPVGDPIASFEKKYKNIKLTLNGTKAGTRYYFCTDDDERPTLRNLTLTYLYAPAQ